MDTFFRIEAKDIEGLNALQLTMLLKLLLHLEARSAGIAERAVEVALNITVGDGGEDGRIKWEDGPPSTNFLPQRFVQFQNKATDLDAAKCANEIVTKDGSMKPMVEEALDQGAAYVLFIGHTYNKEQKDERIAKIREKLTELGKQYAATATIEIYDAGTIEGWANRYVPAIVAVSYWVGRPRASGLKTWMEWSQYSDYQRFSFIMDEERQTVLTNLRVLLAQPKKSARIVGLSGLGKTRLALEIFRDVPGNEDLSTRMVYVDANANPGTLGLVSDWIQCKLEGIVVVDDCNVHLYDKLRREVQRADSRLSVLTLDYDIEQSSNTEIVKLKPLPDACIKQILEPVYGGQIADLDRIVAFAQGFPQMAVLLADARLDRVTEMGNLTNETLLQKMLWGGRVPVEKDERILKGCALFDRFGLDEDVSDEYKFIATEVVEVDVDSFHDCVKRFEERGLIDRRGRYAMLIPKPLAIRLAAEWWRRTRREKQLEVIKADMPNGLAESFCEQIARLDFLPEVKTLAEDLCGAQGPFGQAEVILSEGGSRFFRSLVEVNPEATSRALSRVLKEQDEIALRAIRGDARRNLVWALEKLCFHGDCFEESAWSLLLLASAENESWANNATGQFKQLFRIFLSGTEAPLTLRMRLIDYALADTRPSVRKIAVDALEEAIDTYGGSRTVGAEYQGSGPPLTEWRPKVWGEIFEYWDWALGRLCHLVVNKDVLAGTAKNHIARHLRGLAGNGRLETLDKVIRKITNSEGPLWPEALDAVKDSLRYEGKAMPPEGKAKLQEWVSLLTPTDLGGRLRLLVSIPSWEDEQDEDGHYIDLSVKAAEALAKELSSRQEFIIPHLTGLLVGEQRRARWFAKTLIEASRSWEPLLTETVARIRIIGNPNTEFLIGILNGIFNLDRGQWQDIVQQLSEIEGLIAYYPEFTCSGEVTDKQLNFVVQLVAEGRITAVSASIFCYGRALEHLSPETIMAFTDNLSRVSDEAAWVALDILFMYCHGNSERWELCRTAFREIVLKLRLDRKTRIRQGDIYHWHNTVEKLLDSEDAEFAERISKEIVESCSEKLDIGDLWHYVQPVVRKILKKFGREVWHVFSDAIRNADILARYRLTDLLGSGNRFERGAPSVIADLPDELLREWCLKDPDVAPEFLARATDVLIETSEGTSISPRAQFLFDNFGDNKGVLSSLSMNLGSFGWKGSLVPYLLKELNALERLKNHEKQDVRKWASSRIEYLSRMIEHEKSRDAEHDWGIYK